MAFNTSAIDLTYEQASAIIDRQLRSGKVIDMDKIEKEAVARNDEEQLGVFVRSSPQELTKSDLDLVAGGGGTCIVPNGG